MNADNKLIPKNVYIEPTNICNMQCTFCFQGNNSMIRKKGIMEFDTFKKVIDDITPFKIGVTLHHSGESLLHESLSNFIGYAKEKGLEVGLTTNGVLLDQNNFEILDTGIDIINISLGSVDKEEYSQMRPGQDFDLVMSNIYRLSEEKLKRNVSVHIFVNVIATKENSDNIPKFKEKIKSIKGVDGVIVRKLMDWSNNVDVSQFKVNTGYIRKLVRYLYMYLRFMKRGTLCDAIIHTPSVLWNGDVVPCCVDFNGSLVLGNVLDNNFIDILNGVRAKQLQTMLRSRELTKKNPTCSSCSHTF